MKRAFSHLLVPLCLGLVLRLFFAFKFPGASGDTALYENLAANWLSQGSYAMTLNGALFPVDIRVPGYPAFLAAIYALSGRSGESARQFVMFAQIIVDLLTCLVVASLASALVGFFGSLRVQYRNRPYQVALWLAALCPFTANYTAVTLTETLATFFSAISFYLLVRLAGSVIEDSAHLRRLHASWDKSSSYWAACFGLSIGFAALLRPEAPLLFVIVWFALFFAFWKRHQAFRWFSLVVLSAVVCLIPLIPWTIRNAVTLHKFQPLAPKDATLPTEHTPIGFMAWERTWLYRMSDCYAVTWKLDEEPIDINDIPARAFDSDAEKEQVARLLARHNQTNNLPVGADSQFAAIARHRTSRHPLRTYLYIPMQRALTIWFTPRIELLPFNGSIFPLAREWDEDRPDLLVTLGFIALNLFYLLAAARGLAKLYRASPRVRIALFAIVAYIFIRTAFLTTVEAPEPRYVLVCFPAILALAACAFMRRTSTPDAVQPPA